MSWAGDDGGARHFETEIGSRREVGEEDSDSFCLSSASSGFGLATVAEHPDGAETRRHRLFIVKLEVDEELRIGDPQGKKLRDRGRGLQRKSDMELDEMVGPLLHPIVRHIAEIHGLAGNLQRGEIADLG